MRAGSAGFLDAYEVLGVAADADRATLKAAHRRLVRRFHPDLRPVAERDAATRQVQDVNVAYGLVRDPARRARYDRLREVALTRGTGPLAGFDAAAAAQWEATVLSAGRWARRWWQRHRGRTLTAALGARRAALDAAARVVWLLSTVAGTLLGFLAASGVQRLAGLEGPLLPLAGALSGLWIGSYRGWCHRLRVAGLHDPSTVRRGTLARVAVAVAVMLLALRLDGWLGWT